MKSTISQLQGSQRKTIRWHLLLCVLASQCIGPVQALTLICANFNPPSTSPIVDAAGQPLVGNYVATGVFPFPVDRDVLLFNDDLVGSLRPIISGSVGDGVPAGGLFSIAGSIPVPTSEFLTGSPLYTLIGDGPSIAESVDFIVFEHNESLGDTGDPTASQSLLVDAAEQHGTLLLGTKVPNVSSVFGPTTGITFELIQTPRIVLEHPEGVKIPNGEWVDYGTFAIGDTLTETFTISSYGVQDLEIHGITLIGADASEFMITQESSQTTLAHGDFTSFAVRFGPSLAGTKIAAVKIDNNDPFKSSFLVNLSGKSLSFSHDTDGDGLNDASELKMAGLGFDWEVSQADLVSILFSNANGAELYNEAQIQALHPEASLIGRNPATGMFTLTIGVRKSSDLIDFDPFPMTAPRTVITPEGKLEFEFDSPDDAAFFLLESR